MRIGFSFNYFNRMFMLKRRIQFFIAFICLTSTSTIYSESILQGFDLHGSFAQSYIKTTKGNEWILADSQKGSFQFTELLLNTSKDINGKLRIGAQGIMRDFGSESNFERDIDWMFADYQICDHFGMRLGRIKLPLGLYNESRDVDAARTPIILSQGMYPEWARNIANAYDGLGVYGTVGTMSLGYLNYNIFYGGEKSISKTFRSNRQMEILDPNTRFRTKDMRGFELSYDTPIDGLRFIGSYFSARAYTDLAVTNALTSVKTHYDEAFKFETDTHMFSGEYSLDKWTFSMEVAHIQQNSYFESVYNSDLVSATESAAYAGAYAGTYQAVYQSTYSETYQTAFQDAGGAGNPAADGIAVTAATAAADAAGKAAGTQAGDAAKAGAGSGISQALGFVTTNSSNDITAWSLGAVYQYTEKLSLNFRYAFDASKDQKNDVGFYRRDASLGLRYDYNEFFIGKLEYHHIRGRNGLMSGSSNDSGIFLARISLSF